MKKEKFKSIDTENNFQAMDAELKTAVTKAEKINECRASIEHFHLKNRITLDTPAIPLEKRPRLEEGHL